MNQEQPVTILDAHPLGELRQRLSKLEPCWWTRGACAGLQAASRGTVGFEYLCSPAVQDHLTDFFRDLGFAQGAVDDPETPGFLLRGAEKRLPDRPVKIEFFVLEAVESLALPGRNAGEPDLRRQIQQDGQIRLPARRSEIVECGDHLPAEFARTGLLLPYF